MFDCLTGSNKFDEKALLNQAWNTLKDAVNFYVAHLCCIDYMNFLLILKRHQKLICWNAYSSRDSGNSYPLPNLI